MKRLLYAIRMWLLDVLGGVPKPQYDSICAVLTDYLHKVDDYRIAVREICRRSENTYYDWCCDQCACNCDKRNGWCAAFEPVHYGK
jgi:hypothetical protein